MCNDYKDYDIEIDAQLYNQDYDDVDFENKSETTIESDILFE